MKKKLLVLLPALALALSLGACDRGGNSSSGSSTPSSQGSTSSQTSQSSGGGASSQGTSSEDASSQPTSSSQDASSESSQSSSEDPVVETFKYKLGDGEAVALTKNNPQDMPANQTGQYEAKGVAMTAGQALVFYNGDAAITENLGSDPEDDDHKNNGVFNAGAITIHNDATADIYFKTWQDGGFSYWVDGYVKDTPVASVYKVVGSMNEWSYDNSTIGFVDATVQEEVEQDWYITQEKATFTVAADDEFKVSDGTNWLGGDILEANANFEVLDTEGHEGNIKAKLAGSVELFLKHKAGDVNALAINFKETATYTMHVGSETVTLVDYSDADKGEETWVEQFKAEDLELQKDDVITFKKNDTLITKIGPDGGANNVAAGTPDSGELVVKTTGNELKVYLKKYSDGGYSVWLTGYTEPTPTTATYTLTDIPTEWTDAFDYYAWAWGGTEAGGGKKYDASVSGTSAQTTIPNDATCFLIVKVEKDATWDPADWDTHKLDQSRDVVEISAGITSYPFEAPICSLTLSVEKDSGYGLSVYLVGNFCGWSITDPNVIALEWTAGNIWTKTVNVPYGNYECKLVLAATDSPTEVAAWEAAGDNRAVTLKTASVELELVWGSY